MATKEYTDIKHLVLDLGTAPNSDAMPPAEAEGIVRDYLANGWTLFAVFLVSATPQRVQNEYILVK